MKSKNLILSSLFCVLSCNTPTDLPELQCTQPNLQATTTVELLLKKSNVLATQYTFDDVIEAYVVSSDQSGNFFKTLHLQTLATPNQASVGFSVPMDVSNTYIEYPIGTKVFLKLNSLFIDNYFGGMRIGNLYVNAFNEGTVGRLLATNYNTIVLPSCTILGESLLTKNYSVAEVLKEENLNTLVEISGVQFVEEASGRNFYEPTKDIGGATNWNLIDKNGNQIIFRTSSYANFSSKKVPDGIGTIKGILTKYDTDYQLLARSEKDINLSGTRRIPFFSEDFQNATDNSIINLPGWANLIDKGSVAWKAAVYGTNGCAEFAISGTKVNANSAWLITPKIDLDGHTNEILTFRTAQHRVDVDSPLNTVELYISSDFDGVSFKDATWTKLDFTLANQKMPWYEFIGSGGVDLSGYSGKVNIAFKYIGSGKNTALDGSFQIDDVQVYGD